MTRRLLVISPGYPPDVGGIERVVRATSAQLVEDGWEVEVATQSRGLEAASASLDGRVVVRRFPATKSHDFAVSAGLAGFVRRHGASFDVIHAHNYHALPAAAALLVGSDVPLVFSPHFHGVANSRLATLAHRPYALVGRRIITRAHTVIAVSGAERQLLAERFPGSATRMTVVHNGVDAGAIAQAEPWPDQPPTILIVGRLEPYKNVDITLEAIATLRPVPQVIVIGTGSDRDRLGTIAEQVNVPARFLGGADDETVHRWLRTARVVVTMSEREAFGLTALEAVAGGAIAVCADIPAHREVSGIAPDGAIQLVAPGDRAQLARAIETALEQPNSAPVPVRDWAQVAGDYSDVYQAILRGRLKKSS